METITVSREQLERIEAAWEICSFGNGRKAAAHWSRTFRDCVAEIIGREAPDEFTLVIA